MRGLCCHMCANKQILLNARVNSLITSSQQSTEEAGAAWPRASCHPCMHGSRQPSARLPPASGQSRPQCSHKAWFHPSCAHSPPPSSACSTTSYLSTSLHLPLYYSPAPSSAALKHVPPSHHSPTLCRLASSSCKLHEASSLVLPSPPQRWIHSLVQRLLIPLYHLVS